jgi:uncharacterized membrane protein
VFALAALLLVGASALIGIVVTLKKSPLTRKTAIVILLLSLLSFGLVARTGYLGGKIRHTEVGRNRDLHKPPKQKLRISYTALTLGQRHAL